MRYRLSDLPAILRNPLGPQVIRSGARMAAWPLFRPLTALYRRTLLRRTRVVGVTGSFGKTTTFRAIAAALDSPIAKGSNHKSGIAVRLLNSPLSEPYSVLEVGIDGPGQMRGFAHMIKPDIAVLCGIGSEHNLSLPTLQDTLREKGELIAALPADGLAILNADDPLAISACERTRARVVLCGFSSTADVRALSYRVDWPHGSVIEASVHGRRVEVRTRFVGRQMAFPILAALAAAEAEGVDLQLAADRLAALEPATGRMQLVPLDHGVVLLNDTHKGSLESFIAALDAIAELPAERRLLIVGDIQEPPGKQSGAYRLLGESFARNENAWIFHIGDNRQKLQAGAKRAGFPADRIVGLGKDVLPTIGPIRERLQPGDLVLLKGRNSQKFERILLALQGREVRCAIQFCDRRGEGCLDCPMLERGWDGLPEFMDRRPHARRGKR